MQTPLLQAFSSRCWSLPDRMQRQPTQSLQILCCGSFQVETGSSEGQEVKVSKPKKIKVGSDLVEKPMPAADFQAAAGTLEEVVPNREYIYAAGGWWSSFASSLAQQTEAPQN